MVHLKSGKFAPEHGGRLLGRLDFQINQTLKSRNADAVHDLRVAVRRFSQALRVFKRQFRGKEVRKIRRQLKQIMELAGEVRNCDVALKLVSKSERRNTTGLRRKLESRRRKGEGVLVAFLKHWVNRKSLVKWRRVVASAGSTNSDASRKHSVARIARQLLLRSSEEFFESGNEAAKANASPRDLHGFRISAKKFRYTMELFTSVYGPRLNSFLEIIKRTQGLLGDINDCDTVRRMVSQYQGAGRITAWLEKREHRRIEEFRQYWREMFASGAEVKRWITFLSRPGGTGLVRAAKKPPARAERISQRAARRPVAVA